MGFRTAESRDDEEWCLVGDELFGEGIHMCGEELRGLRARLALAGQAVGRRAVELRELDRSCARAIGGVVWLDLGCGGG